MTGPGGLPITPPPGANLHYLAQSILADHMETDQQPDNTAPLPQTAVTQDRSVSSLQAYRSASHHESRALSNLLQALGHGQPSNASPSLHTSRLPVYPEATSTLPMNGILMPTQTPLGDNETNDAPANNHGPPSNPPLLNSPFELPAFPAPSHIPDQSMGLVTSDLPPPNPTQVEPSVQDRREVEAFAKIEFEDGNYYITTWQCELGRDARAYVLAMNKAEALRNNPATSQSSSGQLSRPSERVLQYVDSQVQGSVLSEAGGFGGIDEDPLDENKKPDGRGYPSHSSQVSSSDVVRPQEVLYHPPTAPFDYHKNAEMQARALNPELEEPAPITDDHAPDPDLCPIIPIHSMSDSLADEITIHKAISRRHVRIEWDFSLECFVLRVLGRNGAFVDGELLEMGDSRRLISGSNIQIGGIEMNFLLPTMKADPLSDESDDEIDEEASNRQSTSLTPNGTSEIVDGQQKMMTPHDSATQATSAVLLGPDGKPMVRKRGPGRPPKDGHMSQREKKLLKKQIELAEAKAANGGTTPPPMGAAKKPSKPPTKEELARFQGKSEKRKYNKRKREGEDGDVIPSIEGGEEAVDSNDERPVAKKSRASKSPSPEYPPLAGLTEEQLQRPTEPYAKVIYDLLLEIYPRALPLKGVYRMIKTRYPFFVHRVESDGWQSSVRHNLNQEHEKLFDKGDKEGKGYAWRAIPGAMRKEERKKAAPATTAKPKPTPQNPPQLKNLPNQQPAPWPNNQSYPPQYWPQSQQSPYAPAREMQYSGQSSHGLIDPSMAPVTNGISSQQRLSSSHELPALPPNYPPYRASIPGLPQQGPALPSNPGTAAPNMPCTLEGIMAIRKYEESIYDQIRKGSNPQSLEYWMQVFASVRKRILHGQSGSIMPSGDTQEELAIMGHVGMIRDRFRNLNFVGFGERRATPPAGAVTSDLAVTNLSNGKANVDCGNLTANRGALSGAAGGTASTLAMDVDMDRSMTASPLTPSVPVNGDVPHPANGFYVPNPDRVV